MMDEKIISLSNVAKSFGRNQVLDDINLTIHKGQSIALVGNNGSGKSTLLKIICGLANATSGKVTYSGKLKFNYVPEHFPKMGITAKQYLMHMGLIEGIAADRINEKLQELLQTFFMEHMADTQMKNLSKGSLQKVAVIQALLSRPDVLLLDEPLSGQDLQSQRRFIHLVKELILQEVTVIMSCHEMLLVNQLSDVAYEIKSQKLEPFAIDKTPKWDWDILYFEKPVEGTSIHPGITGRAHKLDYTEDDIRIVVSREDSNKIILQMIQDGFNLRAMKGIDEWEN